MATNNNSNEVMNHSIVRLNEMKGVKMASLSKSKRPAAKFNKEVATYLLDNWDSLSSLKTCHDTMRKDMPHTSCEEVMFIYENRMAELESEEIAEKEAADAKKRAEAESIEDVKEKKRQEKASKEVEAAKHKVGAPKKHKVGDRHSNGMWIWTEYVKGRFDWRIDPQLKKAPGRKSGSKNAAKSETKAIAKKASKAPAKVETKTDKKSTDMKPKVPKMTLEQLLAKPTPQALSKAQTQALKALKKGFRLRKDGDALWLTDSNGNNERVDKGTLEALQRRYRIDFIPKGLWYEKDRFLK